MRMHSSRIALPSSRRPLGRHERRHGRLFQQLDAAREDRTDDVVRVRVRGDHPATGHGQPAGSQPTTLAVPHGTSITVSDVSTSTPHTFTITGKGIDITNNGGQSQQVTINLPPGTYPFFCKFHVSSGMKGTLVVTSTPGSPSHSPAPGPFRSPPRVP